MAIICTTTTTTTTAATLANPIIHIPIVSPLTRSNSRRCFSRIGLSRSSSSASMESSRAKFMEFPYASAPIRNLMVELLSTVETQLGSSLEPDSTLPRHVQHFENSTATAHASLHLRSGLPSSQDFLNAWRLCMDYEINIRIDFILGGWIHCELPSGGALNITSLSAYLNPLTNAPHFLLELIQNSPTSLVLILDLTPRKDLILYPDYLKTYYEDTQLDKHRQRLHALHEVTPYFSPSLYVRAVVSPSAILVTIDVGAGETSNIEEIVRDHVSPVANELLQFWIQSCARLERPVGEDSESSYLAQRDGIIKMRTLEVDLASSFPRLFGQQVADRVLDALKEYYSR